MEASWTSISVNLFSPTEKGAFTKNVLFIYLFLKEGIFKVSLLFASCLDPWDLGGVGEWRGLSRLPQPGNYSSLFLLRVTKSLMSPWRWVEKSSFTCKCECRHECACTCVCLCPPKPPPHPHPSFPSKSYTDAAPPSGSSFRLASPCDAINRSIYIAFHGWALPQYFRGPPVNWPLIIHPSLVHHIQNPSMHVHWPIWKHDQHLRFVVWHKVFCFFSLFVQKYNNTTFSFSLQCVRVRAWDTTRTGAYACAYVYTVCTFCVRPTSWQKRAIVTLWLLDRDVYTIDSIKLWKKTALKSCLQQNYFRVVPPIAFIIK